MHLRWMFVYGLFWMVLGIISITNNTENYFNYGYLIAAMLCFGIYLFKSKFQYLTFEKDTVTLNSLFSKKINLRDLKQVNRKGKDYTLQTENSELKIKGKLIDKNSLKDLNTIFKKLNF